MEILEETRMTLSEVAEYFDRDKQTIRAWIKNGVRGVKLESVKVGKGVVTSREAIKRFVTATNTTKVA